MNPNIARLRERRSILMAQWPFVDPGQADETTHRRANYAQYPPPPAGAAADGAVS